MRRSLHAIGFILLAIVGIAVTLLAAKDDFGSPLLWTVMGSAAICGLFTPVQKIVHVVAKFSRQMARSHPFRTAFIVAGLCAIYLLINAFASGRDTFPKLHDEHMLLLQGRMLAQGRLWMPQHELADFFESFYLFTRPVYASMYFPGAALMYTPTLWLRLPMYAGPIVASSLVVAVFWLIAAEQIDGFAAMLMAILLLSISKFRYLSFIWMAHTPMLLLGLLMVWAWLRWQKSPSFLAALGIGAFAGWAAITRPVDAIAYALPVGVAMLLTLSRVGNVRLWFITAVAVAIGSAPFLSLQLIQDEGLTGHWFELPYQSYMRENSPESSYGGASRVSDTAMTRLPQKLAFDREFNQPMVNPDAADPWRHWVEWKLPIIAQGTAPTPLLLVLWPMGWLTARRRRWVMASMFVCWVVLYWPLAFMLGHYPVVAAPGVIFGIVLGIRQTEAIFPKKRKLVRSVLCLTVLSAAVVSMIQGMIPPGDDPLLYGTLDYVYNRLPAQLHGPAVVIVRFRPYNNPHQEVVFNTDTAWPDDAAIIKAQDLGPARDAEIIRYYAHVQPGRRMYLLDRGLAELSPVYLGTAAELNARLPTLPAALGESPAPADAWKTKLRND
jgi:hypothetical protein